MTKDELRAAATDIADKWKEQHPACSPIAVLANQATLLARYVLATLDRETGSVNAGLLEACVRGHYALKEALEGDSIYVDDVRATIGEMQTAIRDAEALQAERALPVHADWLLSIGFECLEDAFQLGAVCVCRWQGKPGAWCFYLDGCCGPEPLTRGHVLSMLAALGIPTKGGQHE